MEDFSHTREVDVRVSDLDPLDHVHHAVYPIYFERVRTDYFKNVLDTNLEETTAVIAHIEIDYEKSIHHGDDVVVGGRVPALGRSSIPMEYEIEANGDTAAVGKTIQVIIDEEGETRPIPDDWREAIIEFEEF